MIFTNMTIKTENFTSLQGGKGDYVQFSLALMIETDKIDAKINSIFS